MHNPNARGISDLGRVCGALFAISPCGVGQCSFFCPLAQVAQQPNEAGKGFLFAQRWLMETCCPLPLWLLSEKYGQKMGRED